MVEISNRGYISNVACEIFKEKMNYSQKLKTVNEIDFSNKNSTKKRDMTSNKNQIDFFSKNSEESNMTSRKNKGIDFFSKNSEESNMTSRKNEIDFFSKNSINKGNMTSKENPKRKYIKSKEEMLKRIDFSNKNSTKKRDMTSKENEIDFSNKNSINKGIMTSKENNEIDFFSKNSEESNMTSKRKYVKSGNYTKEEILKRKMNKIFEKFKKLYDKEEENWYEKIANMREPINELKKDVTIPTQNTGKRKYIKSGYYTQENIFNRKYRKLTGKFEKITGEAETSLKEEKSWYEKLKKNILSLFFKQDPKFELDKEALNATKRYVLDLVESGLSLQDPMKLLETTKSLVIEKFEENPMTKQQLTLVCLMKKANPATGKIITDNSHFHSHQQKILKESNFDEIFENMQNKIIKSFEEYLNQGSQWQFQKGLKLYLSINKIKILNASSYIPLPKFLKDKNAIINPENFDKKCFLWCIAISEILKRNPNLRNPGRITKILEKEVEKFNLDGMDFPCKFPDIEKFEKNNNISVNVFGYEEKEILPLRISEKEGERINILLIEKDGNSHYCLIKNKSRLFSNQVNKHDGKIYICDYCLQNFNRKETHDNHLEYCKKFKCGKTVYPEKGETMKFKNYERMHNVPFVIKQILNVI